MTNIRTDPVLRYQDLPATPWRNGRGVTREVARAAIAAPQAEFEAFAWRLSMAEIGEPAPFSVFSGIDRALGTIRGTINLIVEDTELRLNPGDEPALFRGDAPASAAAAGALRTAIDLNLMVTDTLGWGSMTPLQPGILRVPVPPTVASPRGRVLTEVAMFVIAANDVVVHLPGGSTLALQPGDVMPVRSGDAFALAATGPAGYLVMAGRFELPAVVA